MSRRKPDPRLTAAFGRIIRALREEKGFKQEAFAYHCNLDRASYGRIERGAQAPNMATIWQIAEGLGVRPHVLISEVEKILETNKKLEAEKGARKSTASPAAKQTGKYLGKADSSGRGGELPKGGGKD